MLPIFRRETYVPYIKGIVSINKEVYLNLSYYVLFLTIIIKVYASLFILKMFCAYYK
jgi:hypothetical protein